MALAIFLTGDLLRECTLSSRTSTFDQERRLGRLARLFAISHLLDPSSCYSGVARRRLPAPEGPSLAASISIYEFTRPRTINFSWCATIRAGHLAGVVSGAEAAVVAGVGRGSPMQTLKVAQFALQQIF
jgi:hypothetical protein